MRIGLIILLILFIGNIQLYSQAEKFNITAGAGYPEALNVGVRYQLNQQQVGLGLGYGMSESCGSKKEIKTSFSISADYFYHFGGTSEFSNRHPWFARAGLYYHKFDRIPHTI